MPFLKPVAACGVRAIVATSAVGQTTNLSADARHDIEQS